MAKSKANQDHWKRHARPEARLRISDEEYDDWRTKVRDALNRVEEQLNPNIVTIVPTAHQQGGRSMEEAYRLCKELSETHQHTWRDGTSEPVESVVEQIKRLKGEDANMEEAHMRQTIGAEDYHPTNEGVRYLGWDEKWPEWQKARDNHKRLPEPMCKPRSQPNCILRFMENEWHKLGGKIGGRLIVARIAAILKVFDVDPDDDTYKEHSLVALDSELPLPEACRLLMSAMSDRNAENRFQKQYEARQEEILDRLDALKIRTRKVTAKSDRRSQIQSQLAGSLRDIFAATPEPGQTLPREVSANAPPGAEAEHRPFVVATSV